MMSSHIEVDNSHSNDINATDDTNTASQLNNVDVTRQNSYSYIIECPSQYVMAFNIPGCEKESFEICSYSLDCYFKIFARRKIPDLLLNGTMGKSFNTFLCGTRKSIVGIADDSNCYEFCDRYEDVMFYVNTPLTLDPDNVLFGTNYTDGVLTICFGKKKHKVSVGQRNLFENLNKGS